MSIGIAGSVGSPGGGGGGYVSGFVPAYVAGAPATVSLAVASGTGAQRVAIPAGATTIRISLFGYGPFYVRRGASNVVATTSDTPAIAGDKLLLPVEAATHLAIYGDGSGKMIVEGGSGGFG